MNFIRPILPLLLCITFSVNPAWAAEDPKSRDIKHLFEVMRITETEKQSFRLVLESIIDMHRKEKPSIPAKFWDESLKVLTEEFKHSLDGINKSQVAIYANHYSDEEIKQLIAFYESPIGQKVIRETPQITKEAFAVGKIWGHDMGLRAIARLKQLAQKKGYNI